MTAEVAGHYTYKTCSPHRETVAPIYHIGFPEGNRVIHEKVIEIDENENGQRVHFGVINKLP